MRSKNTSGGGANTNKNGLKFEQETDLKEAFKEAGLIVSDEGEVFIDNNMIGMVASKHQFYHKILCYSKKDAVEKGYVSKYLLPDDVFYNTINQHLYVIEKKFQKQSGSVDEKLQTCEFKLIQFTKLAKYSAHQIDKVHYFYYLSDFFRQSCYQDVLQFICDKGCNYYFDQIPLEDLGIEFDDTE